MFLECLGAQSERSRQRSGPIRSVPVGADVKRDVDFDCPEEFGYYPHPTDCTLYYVCVFGGALLESCTGGLMYSHELQTCDWPRNVGCDGTSAVGGEELERINEREQDRNINRHHERVQERHQERNQQRNPLPPPPPPRRNPPPPPPPRAQPNPVVTSRGQPKFDRDEYEKQQQLYAEVDDLPPVEEIESDRQQRVYRGQPSTIGQVQKDRDGYGSQVVSSRTINANIIPASIPQNSGKIGSFSFGTQVDERRSATATPAPQTYSEDNHDSVTDSPLDRQLNIATNVIDVTGKTEEPLSRKKRELNNTVSSETNNSLNNQNASQRNDGEYQIFETNPEQNDDEHDRDSDFDEDSESSLDDVERGKRQVRYLLHKGYKNSGKGWSNSKPVRFVDIQQFNYNPNAHNTKHQPTFSGLNNNHFVDATRKPYPNDNNLYSTANPFASFQGKQNENNQNNQFKPSFPDPFPRFPHAPMNVATQIITKSPPISALSNNENPFSAFAIGGFYNNIPSKNSGNQQQNQNNNNQYLAQSVSVTNQPFNQASFQDSSLLGTTLVTAKPVPSPSTPRPRPNYKVRPDQIDNTQVQKEEKHQNHNLNGNQYHANHRPAIQDNDYDDEEDDEEEEDDDESEENEGDRFKHDFAEPPYEFTHPSNKYANIENPFADPNFDFDAFLAKLRGDTSISVSSPKPKTQHHQNHAVKIMNTPIESSTQSISGVKSSTMNYIGMSTPRPFTIPVGGEVVSRPEDNEQNFGSTTEREQIQKFKNLIQQSISQHQQIYRQHQQQLQQQQNQNDNIRQQQQPHDQNVRQQQSLNEKYRLQQQHQQNENILQQLQQQKSQNENVRQQQHFQHQQQQQSQNSGTAVDAIRPKLKPPNFKDDRKLPITYNFERQVLSTPKPNYNKFKDGSQQLFTVTQKPYLYVTGTGSPIILSTPKQQFIVKPDKIISLQPQFVSTSKPYLVSTLKPQHAYAIFKQSTAKPLTTLANEQLSALRHYWNNPTTEFYLQSTPRPSNMDIPKLESLFAQAIRSSTQSPLKQKEVTSTTTKTPPKRRPIPKPSPEMNDYYYEEDEQYYYEPPVKSKYMPSTEVKPQRPPMAQNYQEYDDFEDSEESSGNNKPLRTQFRRPSKYKPETVTKNHNDVSVVTKSPLKDANKYVNGKIPVFVEYGTPAPNVLMRPEVSNYKMIHHLSRNRTLHMRKPTNSESGPFTLRPPKYLNQTTLRPYTVRHRLAKPTTAKGMTHSTPAPDDNKQTRGRMRHHNIVAQMKFTTPRDSQKQETRYTKTKHDDKTNSLEPTESVTPSSYASPRPKMLYNGSQAYSPDQYDPYYAVYDEDGELYKDPDYVQQYNTASLRPVVQQTYRGSPPPAPAPARRPIETYTARPTQEDYDDALIHGQINNQNQYQAPIRHSTRGEGNELGYDNNPSSVKTTIYEVTSISTTPSTTSTTSTTQRPTIAPFTEAMTPSRYTPRSPTDDNPDSPSEHPSDGSTLPIPSSPSPMINFSSLAKPFEKTDNSYRLQDTITSTERLLNARLPVTNSNVNKAPLNFVPSKPKGDKVVSLTTGFSIRRNPESSNNPYTLTVLTRPFDHFNKSYSSYAPGYRASHENYNKYIKDNNDAREISIESEEDTFINSQERPIDVSMRRKDSSSEIVSDEDEVRIRIRPSPNTILKPRIKLAPSPSTGTTKYYLKTVIKRPAGFATNNEEKEDSTENIINTEALIENGLYNARASGYLNSQLNDSLTTESSKREKFVESKEDHWSKPLVISPYRTLDNLKHEYVTKEKYKQDFSTTTAATTRFTTTVPKELIRQYVRTEGKTTSKPAYYSYRVVDEEVPDHTTEALSSTVKNIIKAFFNNFSLTPKPTENYFSTTPKTTTTPMVEKVVNIGFQKKPYKYVDEKPLRNNVKRLQIVTEPSANRVVSSSEETVKFTEKDTEFPKDYSSTSASSVTDRPLVYVGPQTTSASSAINRETPARQEYDEASRNSKFSLLVSNRPEASSTPETKNENSRKFQKFIYSEPSPFNYRDKSFNNNAESEVTKLTNVETTKTAAVPEWNRQTNKVENEIATTTSMTKSTTVRTEPTTPTTKSISFPTRPSRVNPAIKLAATNSGGGRRSYQSPTKCSTDNSLQANPKCNEIKYQRPSSTRGRGSAHYSTLSGSEVPQQQTANRGTPPTRSRPTLKPSTAVVTNPHPLLDIYQNPPTRPAPVYPQPTPDKTAAKCRKDVCLLPDCYCGGKDIPGDLPVETVPQIVLLTFDDSVNDLNKGLYADLFEKGRVNPNGCPISATFYVSHEWTDYSQVQNLYSAGHEMASHTISHSFGEQFSQKKWNREVGGQREILAAYGGVKLEDVRGMRAPFLSVGGNKMFKMLYDSNFTYDSSLPVYENRPPSWPYTLDYKLFHDCMIPPCPTKSYPGVWEVPMVMWQDLNGGRCSMGDACANPPESEGVYKMLLKNFDRHYTTNRAPFGLFYHAAWFTQPHHKEGFIMFLDFINQMQDVWIVTNWQALQWVRDPTPISRLNNFQPFQCNYQDRPKKCNNPKVCNLWHKSGVRYMRTCQPCPEVYPWTGKTGIKSSRIDNDIED
ncbi:hypothetical protein O0L34_g14721 [Tuta absoluta]|nr:hypothetical protein O0L34_g14721 [Tuta absoluta]